MIEKLKPLNKHAITEPEVRARDMIFRLEDKINEIIDHLNLVHDRGTHLPEGACFIMPQEDK